MASHKRTARTAGLDGLRALAALSVVCLHVWLYTQPNPDHPVRIGFFSHAVFEFRLGLIFFFVLSGYLLHRAFAGAALRRSAPVDVGLYARRRVARIVPAYWLSLVGTFVLLWGARGSDGVRLPDHATSLPAFFVFGQNYVPDTFMRLNPVTWTLALEAAFYVLLPLIGFAAYRLGRGSFRAQVGLLLGIGAAAIGYLAVVYTGHWSAMAAKALPAYMPYFVCGMLVALWAERRRTHDAPQLRPAVTWALVCGGFALAVIDGWWHSAAVRPGDNALISILADIPAGAGFALVVAAAVAGSGRGMAWMSVRPLAWVGLVSYAVYLWHVPLLLFLRSVGLLPSSFVPALALVLPLVLAVAAASWYLVERPILARAHRPRREPRASSRQSRQLEAHAAP